mmetsp:Transcript_100183/g.299032  ORF Transcript_100183/g.299032 Transcript_100183/m.299032 type:complete len:222 (-) Transcript_100183:910-1575(-)
MLPPRLEAPHAPRTGEPRSDQLPWRHSSAPSSPSQTRSRPRRGRGGAPLRKGFRRPLPPRRPGWPGTQHRCRTGRCGDGRTTHQLLKAAASLEDVQGSGKLCLQLHQSVPPQHYVQVPELYRVLHVHTRLRVDFAVEPPPGVCRPALWAADRHDLTAPPVLARKEPEEAVQDVGHRQVWPSTFGGLPNSPLEELLCWQEGGVEFALITPVVAVDYRPGLLS